MKKNVIIITLASVVLVSAVAAGISFNNISNKVKAYDNVIYPGVKVEDVDLSGKTKVEALAILNQKYGDALIKKKINIKAPEKTYTLNYEKLSAKYNIEKIVDEAFSYNKDKGLLQKNKLIKSPTPKQFKLTGSFTFDSKPVKELIGVMQKEIDKQPANAAINMVSRGNFSITPDKKGSKLNTENLEKDILSKISGDLNGDVEIQAPVEDVQASITGDKLSKINTKLSSFSTNFSTSTAARATNISLATSFINGKVLMPGETFSFNDVVGQRTASRGFQEAPVIIGNKVDSGLGGGICQVSTTLYNAAIRANLQTVERIHHTLPSHYIGLGMDATVDYGNIDYKFKNTLEFPVYIEAYTENRNIVFSVYSDKSLTSRTYDLVNEVYDTMQPEVKYVDDPNMDEGVTETVQPASIGYKVRVYKNTYENGKLIAHDLITNETYNKVDGTVKRGTRKKQ
ncbi:VanW family protein [Clostridium omnivorum]|uniref:Exported protein n=1 Tax=Clostridium omnivorum TaxID=1604902 RepID=A0ABQ5N1M2_9CLOT|nr:VanW family protein [Clostridium sp. E14]GLC29061.1 exported protein [Clostridium sp. E14]